MIALTSASANILTIASGPTVFGEPLPEEPVALLVRLAAFALVITAAAMTPPPELDGSGQAKPQRELGVSLRVPRSRSAVVTGILRARIVPLRSR